MRILHVTPYWEDAWAYGGIPRVVGALVRQQAAEGHDVTVCTTDARSADQRMPLGVQPPDGRVDLRVFRNRWNRLAHDWQVFTPAGMHRYLRRHAHEFDVAHLHACRNVPGAMAAHYLHRYGVPYVLAPNGTAPIIERRRLAKRVFDVMAGRRVLQRAAAVVAVSDAERRSLLSLGVRREQIHVVPNPVDPTEFSPPIERGAFRRRAGLTSETLVTFLGKITPRKRLDVVVRAFARLAPGARLVLAGNDMGGLDGARALARTCGVESRLIVTGLVEGRARLELLADADVVIYAGDDEVFGLVAIEAILAGTPVVVAGDSGCGEIITRVGGGLVVPSGDDRAVADAASRILSEPAAWRDEVHAASGRILSEFGAREVADRLVQVYREVCLARTLAPARQPGVTFVVPIRNGMPGLARTIASIEAQSDGRPTEIIAVDDRSADASSAWLKEQAAAGRLRLADGGGRGMSAALNLGVTLARHPVICQVDQDVVLQRGWMSRLTACLERDPELGAVQGHYTTDPDASILERVMALDLEQRYRRVEDGSTSHVCTGNTAYRADALRAVGGFDESLGYGNDVEMSHRLIAAGWKLGHCRQARSFHRWRAGLVGYWRQQFGFGYGRIDIVSRDRRRIAGDSVATASMMAHPIAMTAALASLTGAAVTRMAGGDSTAPALIGLLLIAGLAIERAIAGLRAFVRFGDGATLVFPVVHLIRDLAWVAAIAAWTGRRIARRPSRPAHSMAPRPAIARFIPCAGRTIGILPAHNEAATIGTVLAEVRACHPDLDLLVVDDGSTDNGIEIVRRAGVRWLQLPERMGVGSAMRAGLRYARRLGYDSAIRVDADGQHSAQDIERLRAPIVLGQADVVLGSRFLTAPPGGPWRVRAVQRVLASCLSMLTRATVTDPTSGFCAFGPRAMRLLAEDHPTGYPEPEMRLLFGRLGLTVLEVPVASRPRLGGRTSLTAMRLAAAGARVLLAMLIVPLRRAAGGGDDA